ncbi:hypothetical protein Oweho_1543 [Owenweeksia hongkongensis DSM 17368]|uniref:DUF4856 domain-containing protein n=1 Tax=Owenweeksia hongkongensis (strain DSM 17368 / CIP 108786 / JCM 12287 / NRRL B-23963 / UST20020801) TaxID=926562 RepID=G8R8V3_OWEHD|nr:DUF4856 domain-containing protein [Owenweeksia hongkongensis]AEV32533.1 hypothetical protein Oweho_1543 [Owenweeksia hongkongensis DSM 17368]
MRKLLLSVSILSTMFLSSCKEETTDTVDNTVNLPDTYNFENVDHSGQDQRLDMFVEIASYVKSSNDGDLVDKDIVFDMLTNENYTWTNTELNSATKQIADKIEPEAGIVIGNWIEELSSISGSTTTGSNGTAGLVQSNSGTKQYLFSEFGMEYGQLIEKGMMGALAFYQATAVYMSSSKMDVDNETVEAGKGTDMQHHWDEAYGYFGAPNDFGSAGFNFDNTATYNRFWAKYTNSLNDALGCNTKIMKAFIKGRDAINRKDYETRDAAISEVRQEWELVVAGMAIHYLNGAKADLADDALRNHQLSEAAGFIWSLQFNPETRMTESEVMDILENKLPNLYEVSVQDLNDIIDTLATTYGLSDVKDAL